MGKFKNVVSISGGGGSIADTVPPPPEVCTITGCCIPAIINIVTVSYNGRNVAGVFSAFGSKTGDKWILRPGIRFLSWTTRCATHYQRDVDQFGGRYKNSKFNAGDAN